MTNLELWNTSNFEVSGFDNGLTIHCTYEDCREPFDVFPVEDYGEFGKETNSYGRFDLGKIIESIDRHLVKYHTNV